ncbi:MAG: DNA mismatch repair endonuclease MutL, partial [Clostridia bacterium]|nr:DNA mismatch repair endonuclease MutL [Clostridia bacterium]
MAKINLLDPSVFNMISAGEVVERPASVVKELVENSIDAGATQIDITIVDGGLKRIQVSDNGIGIEKDDIRSAFLPHATSKLERIRDLETLSTLGFRGEALASISSVSEVTLISKTAKDDVASYIYLSAGKVIDERVDSRANGTSITVENLFFNTPARLKFMKVASAEQRAIVSTIEKIVFANPHISITINDGKKTIFEHQSGDLKEAICSIWGGDTFSKMIPVDYEKAGIRVNGYVSNLDFSKATRSWQAYVVNGRAVENRDLALAVDKAYEGKLVKNNYPFCVLDIILPFNEVDINVHPRKSEVRFRNKSSVFSAVYYAINKAFDEANPFSSTSFLPEKDNLSLGEIMSGQYSSAEDFGYRITNPKIIQESIKDQPDYEVPKRTMRDYEREHQEYLDQAYKAFQEKTPIIGDCSGDDQLAMQYGFLSQELANKIRLANPTGFFDGKIVGQIFDTYLIVEREGVVYIIDQHAAHERILYDKLTSRLEPKYIQPLLIPYRFKLSPEETDYFEKIMPNLNNMGFDIDKKFDYYMIYSVPDLIVEMNFQKFL